MWILQFFWIIITKQSLCQSSIKSLYHALISVCISIRPLLILKLCFSISCVTAPLNSLPGSSCNNLGYFKCLLYIFFKCFNNFFAVFGSQWFYLIIPCSNINHFQSKIVCFVCSPNHNSIKWQKQSAWCTSYFAKTSNLGLIIFLGVCK